MYNEIGGDKFEELANKGVIEIPWTCEGHYKDLFFRPAERTLKAPEVQLRPIENVVNIVYLDDKNSVMRIRQNKFKIKTLQVVSPGTIMGWSVVFIVLIGSLITMCYFGIPRHMRATIFQSEKALRAKVKILDAKEKVKNAKDVVDRSVAIIHHHNERAIDIRDLKPKKNEQKIIVQDHCYEGGRSQSRNEKDDYQYGKDIPECSGYTKPASKCRDLVPMHKKSIPDLVPDEKQRQRHQK